MLKRNLTANNNTILVRASFFCVCQEKLKSDHDKMQKKSGNKDMGQHTKVSTLHLFAHLNTEHLMLPALTFINMFIAIYRAS